MFVGRFLASNGVGVKGVKSETLMFVWLVSSIKLVLSERLKSQILMFVWLGFLPLVGWGRKGLKVRP
jgi:hypothetical protein